MWVDKEKPKKASQDFKRKYQAFRDEWIYRKSQYEIAFEEFEYNDEFQKGFGSYFEGMSHLEYQGEFYV